MQNKNENTTIDVCGNKNKNNGIYKNFHNNNNDNNSNNNSNV